MTQEEKESLRAWAKSWYEGIFLVQGRQVLELLAENEAEVAFRKECQVSAVEMNNAHVAEIRRLQAECRRLAADTKIEGPRTPMRNQS